MASLEEIRSERIAKLEKLRAAGFSPYPATTKPDLTLGEVAGRFAALESAGTSHTVVGRVLSIREQGGLAFCHFSDGTAQLQALLKADTIGAEAYELFTTTVDIGDFWEVSGTFFVTKRGEPTIAVATWRMLAKSLRPLPEKWSGLQDEEERLRRRYLDILTNPAERDLVEKRSRFWAALRDFLNKRDFLEVETPILQTIAGGAEALPFVTHQRALDLDLYLRISPELWLKRLLVAGLPKVFEIGRIFRNEGMDAEHLQDYTQMEFYWAYADYHDGMRLVEELYKYLAEQTFGTLKFSSRGFSVDLGATWEIYDYRQTILEQTGIDITSATLPQIEEKLRALEVAYSPEGWNRQRALDTLWKYCRKQIAGPGFLIGVPVELESLAKRSAEKPEIVERFQVILAGSEMGKGFSELNDPLEQAERFSEQAKLRAAGDAEAHMPDQDFVEALEYGMPPACGFGVSERLFSFLLDRPVRNGQIFPLLKPRE